MPDQLEPRLTDHELRTLAGIPDDIRRVSYAGRIEHALVQFIRIHAQGDPEPGSFAALRAQLTLQERLRGLSVELAAARFEIDCLGDRIEDLRDRFDRSEQDRERNLTIASIAIGAILGVAAGAWELGGADSDGPAWMGVAAGTGSAALGIAALLPSGIAVELHHPRNPLGAIVTNHDPQRIFGTFLWRMLHSVPSGGTTTLREKIVAKWSEQIGEAVPPSERERIEMLLFGEGGVYDASALDLREALFDVLEREIDAMYRDLERVGRYVRHIESGVLPTQRASQESLGNRGDR